MKIWNLVAILTISCLLPILGQKPDNDIDPAGSTCENELGQFCIDKNDTHKCMFPLAKPECPAGKQCCKTFTKDYDSDGLPLMKAKKCTKKCPCCVAKLQTNIDSNMDSKMEELQTNIDSNMDSKMEELQTNMSYKMEEFQQMTQITLQEIMAELRNTTQSIKCNTTDSVSCEPPSLFIEQVGCISLVTFAGKVESQLLSNDDSMSWESARAMCSYLGLNMLQNIKWEHLVPLSKHFIPLMQNWYVWIGAKQSKWISSGNTVDSNLWWDGEPNGNNNDDCGLLYLHPAGNIGLLDYGCHYATAVLCHNIL